MIKNIILVSSFVIYVIVLSQFSRTGFPKDEINFVSFPYLSEKPLTEDGFYSLTIAWNIGTGKGITYTLSQPTTGFQPLYVIVLSPIAWLVNILGGSKIEFLRFVILFSGLLLIIFLVMILKLSKLLINESNRRITETLVILLVLFNFKLLIQFFNGLETGLYLIVVCATIIFSIKLATQKLSIKYYVFFGILLGLSGLTRVDFLFTALIFLVTFLFLSKINFKEFLVTTCCFTLTVIPWFIFVNNITGSFFPSSVLVQATLPQFADFSDRLNRFFFAFINPFIPFFYTGMTNTAIFYVIAIFILYFLIRKFLNERKKLSRSFETSIVFFWGMAFIVLIFIYLVFASVPYFFSRYFSIIYVITLPLLGGLLASYFNQNRKLFYHSLISIAIILFIANNFFALFYGKKHYTLAARLTVLEDKIFANKRIGLFQSGVAGFYLDNVVNLDGKVNHIALKYARNHQLERYIDSLNIDVLMEWKEAFSTLSSDYLQRKWQLYDKEIPDNRSVLYIRKKLTE